jgi:hypothetical protein
MNLQLVLLAGFSLFLLAGGVVILYKVRRDPKEREKRRRLAVAERGRLGDALVTDVSDSNLHYTYSIAGVAYNTAQDIAALRPLLPDDLDTLIGNAHMKYMINNPGNSIIISERWSGLRKGA